MKIEQKQNINYWKIEDLPNFPQKSLADWHEQGIYTTKNLLQKAQTSAQKHHLSQQLKIHLNYLQKWIAMADLARSPSVGCQYCGLLLHSGIISLKSLANTPISRLRSQIVKLQVATLRQRSADPSVAIIKQWIKEAQFINKLKKL